MKASVLTADFNVDFDLIRHIFNLNMKVWSMLVISVTIELDGKVTLLLTWRRNIYKHAWFLMKLSPVVLILSCRCQQSNSATFPMLLLKSSKKVVFSNEICSSTLALWPCCKYVVKINVLLCLQIDILILMSNSSKKLDSLNYFSLYYKCPQIFTKHYLFPWVPKYSPKRIRFHK